MKAKWLRIAVVSFSFTTLGALSMRTAQGQGGVPAPAGSTTDASDDYRKGYNEGVSKGRAEANERMAEEKKAMEAKEKEQQQGGCCA